MYTFTSTDRNEVVLLQGVLSRRFYLWDFHMREGESNGLTYLHCVAKSDTRMSREQLSYIQAFCDGFHDRHIQEPREG